MLWAEIELTEIGSVQVSDVYSLLKKWLNFSSNN